MATLLNSLFFVIKMSCLPKYRIIIMIVFCKMVQWDVMYRCVWLDMSYMLAFDNKPSMHSIVSTRYSVK